MGPDAVVAFLRNSFRKFFDIATPLEEGMKSVSEAGSVVRGNDISLKRQCSQGHRRKRTAVSQDTKVSSLT